MNHLFRLKLVVIGCGVGSTILTVLQTLLGITNPTLYPYTAAMGAISGGIVTLLLTEEVIA